MGEAFIETTIPLSPLNASETLDKILLDIERSGMTVKTFRIGTDYQQGLDTATYSQWGGGGFVGLAALGGLDIAMRIIPHATAQPFRVVVVSNFDYATARGLVARAIGNHAGWTKALRDWDAEIKEHVVEPTLRDIRNVSIGIGTAVGVLGILYLVLLLKK